MPRYFLDTNHLSGTLDVATDLRDRIRSGWQAGARFGTSIPVLCELECGIVHTAGRKRNRRLLDQTLRLVSIWPLERSIVPVYASLYQELRRAGRVLSQVDMLSAAMVRHRGLILRTSDRDFEAVSSIRTENWLAPR